MSLEEKVIQLSFKEMYKATSKAMELKGIAKTFQEIIGEIDQRSGLNGGKFDNHSADLVDHLKSEVEWYKFTYNAEGADFKDKMNEFQSKFRGRFDENAVFSLFYGGIVGVYERFNPSVDALYNAVGTIAKYCKEGNEYSHSLRANMLQVIDLMDQLPEQQKLALEEASMNLMNLGAGLMDELTREDRA
ncbi:MAG TPA: hypothetical protein VJB89_00070 [Candidatus Nanoarchaeia archaeon]|nr:hypothetical protein [Candidatus Nanoarchaeia archaeon]